MNPEAQMYLLLMERRQRRLLEQRAAEQSTGVVAQLRAWYHPAQASFYRRDRAARWRATKKTRRSGATSGGVREFIARAVEQPGWRGSYVTNTAKEARTRAWISDTNSGFAQVIRAIGTRTSRKKMEEFIVDGVTVEVRHGDMILEFSNGSQIELFGADTVGDHDKRRGHQKHVIWIDEVQSFPLLEEFFDAVVLGCLVETAGECWLTGTPSIDCAGMFYEITKEETEERLPNWEVHVLTSKQNPLFGAVIQADDGYWVQDNLGGRSGPFDTRDEAEVAAQQVRWDRTAGDILIAKNWKGDEPDFVREWLGQWVKTDARYVYPVHDGLIFAPQRLKPNPINAAHPPWYDHDAALRDLPTHPRYQYQWMFALAADFGYYPDPFALVVNAFCYQLPEVYEMFSWKCIKVDTDDQGRYMKLLWATIDRIVSFVGDAAGKQSDFAVWQTRMNMPIEEANKKGKNDLEEFLANDIRANNYRFRGDPESARPRNFSPLYTEMKYLTYLPTKPGKPRVVDKHKKVAGIAYGDHCADATRYSYNDLRHFLAKRPTAGSEAGSEAWHNERAEKERRDIAEAQRAGRYE